MKDNQKTYKVKLRQDRYTKLMHIPVEVASALEWEKGDEFEITVLKDGIKVEKVKDK